MAKESGNGGLSESDVDALIATHAADVDAHHTKYTDAEADARAAALIATHASDVDAHHEAQPTNHRARAHPNANQSVPSGAWTLITLDVEDYDPGSHFASNRYTVAKAGIYLIVTDLYFVNISDTKAAMVGIYKNGTLIASQGARVGSAGDCHCNCSAIIELAVDDYIELKGSHNDVANRDAHCAVTFMAVNLIAA